MHTFTDNFPEKEKNIKLKDIKHFKLSSKL